MNATRCWNCGHIEATTVCRVCKADKFTGLTIMHGMPRDAEWNVDKDAGLKNAVAWMERHVAMMANGATWAIPRSGSVIKIDKVNKIATRTVGVLPETSTQKVFEAMGWKWIDKAGD